MDELLKELEENYENCYDLHVPFGSHSDDLH